jgi:single-strand DNA-binding protein
MADSFVKVTGNIGRDPEVRHFESGKKICQFSIALYQGKNKQSAWMDVECWGAIADAAAQLAKGNRITVTGQIGQDEWEDKSTGQKRTKIKIKAESVAFTPWEDLDGNNSSSQSTQRQSQPASMGSNQDTGKPIDDYDSIPF